MSKSVVRLCMVAFVASVAVVSVGQNVPPRESELKKSSAQQPAIPLLPLGEGRGEGQSPPLPLGEGWGEGSASSALLPNGKRTLAKPPGVRPPSDSGKIATSEGPDFTRFRVVTTEGILAVFDAGQPGCGNPAGATPAERLGCCNRTGRSTARG